ncbi:MAG: peptide deformylase [Clostridia bacterium]|nr:peptide deformylase [Clostridia bacterium]
MAILKILTEEDPILRKTSRKVDAITPRIQILLDDMIATLHKSGGVGLAAPQVGVLRRVVVVETEPGNLIELINPVIVETSGSQTGQEGCLSLPGRWGICTRPDTVTVEATNRRGERFRVTGTGLTARCFCHELDHLDGILYPDVADRMLTRAEIDKMMEDDD